MNFNERLKLMLDYTHTTQKELAQDIGVSTSTISRWCRGQGLPNIKEIADICEALWVQPSFFIGAEPRLDELLQKYSDGLIK